MGDLEDDGRGGGQGVDVAEEVGEVDGAVAGPEVFITLTVVVVEVEFGDAGVEELEGGVDAGAGVLEVGEVGVADVEGEADAVEGGRRGEFRAGARGR